MDAAELGRVKVAAVHVDDDSDKVPLDGDLLVSYLNGRERAQQSHTASPACTIFQVTHQHSYSSGCFAMVPIPWLGMSLEVSAPKLSLEFETKH